jgi:hypothetical protein
MSSLAALSKEEVFELRKAFEIRQAFQTADEAAILLDRVGVMGTWSAIGSLPSLGMAVKPGPGMQQLIWDLHEILPDSKRAHYGKVLDGKGTMIAVRLLPALVSMAGGTSYEDRYSEGRLSSDAHRVARTLETEGALPANQLRQASGYGSKEKGKLFEAALGELQRQFLIVTTGRVPGTAKFKIVVWDLIDRWYPANLLADLPFSEATQSVIEQLIQTGGLILESELISWLKHYPAKVPGDVDALVAADRVRVRAIVGKTRALITPENEARLR